MRFIFQKADVAVSAMFITYERQQYIHFTKPYMDLGLTILMPKNSPQKNLFAFIEPFEIDLWTAVIGAMVVCGVATTICSYLSPFGFYGRYSQRLDQQNLSTEEERKKLNIFNSLWFSFAALMQQVSSFTVFHVHTYKLTHTHTHTYIS